MGRPLRATILPAALAANLQRVRHFAPGARVWAVVKANAYGHGLAQALAGFAAADGLALLEFDGAARLRELGWRGPLLMLEGPFEPADVIQADRLDLGLALHRPEQVDWVLQAGGARAQNASLDIYLKFNSGMNRLGMRAVAFRDAWQRLHGHAAVRSITLMTHFANADLEGGAAGPLQAFEDACAGLAGLRSTSNSAAIIDLAAGHADWVRPGIMLYGATPFAGRSAASLGLQPAMVLHSQLIAVQPIAAGESVGYGSQFTADAPMRIGIVACGYADGYPRHAPTGTPIVVAGVRTRLVGRVSMDMLAVDITAIADARVGSPVELWGTQLPIDEVASAAGTIGYELMCALAPRVPVDVQR